MRAKLITAIVLASIANPAIAKTDCTKEGAGLGVSRVIEIDASNGPLFGEFTKHTKEDDFLGPKEVVLTFDDGPIPRITKSILNTLDEFCTKATFFSVGKMALNYPSTVKDVLARGHTLGGHTWTHPLNLRRYSLAKATDQIERGFAAIALAAGQPIAPFFRFPGLSDSGPMLKHLQQRGIASFTVDVISNDSYIGSSSRLASYTLRKLEARKQGIILFHDIKSATARALPTILRQLKQRGYKVVHLKSKVPLVVKPDFDDALKPMLAKAAKRQKTAKAKLTTPSGTATESKPDANEDQSQISVTKLAPPVRRRETVSKRAHPKTAAPSSRRAKKRYRRRSARQRRRYRRRPPPPSPFLF